MDEEKGEEEREKDNKEEHRTLSLIIPILLDYASQILLISSSDHGIMEDSEGSIILHTLFLLLCVFKLEGQRVQDIISLFEEIHASSSTSLCLRLVSKIKYDPFFSPFTPRSSNPISTHLPLFP